MENNKKKLRFNLFDGIVIAVILVVMIGVYLVIQTKDSSSISTTTVTYTVELTNLAEGSGDLLQPGDAMKDNVKNYQAGTVVSVEEIPYTVATTDKENGVMTATEVPGYCSLLVTLQVECTESDSALTTTDGMPIRVGLSESLSNSRITGAGYIVSIER